MSAADDERGDWCDDCGRRHHPYLHALRYDRGEVAEVRLPRADELVHRSPAAQRHFELLRLRALRRAVEAHRAATPARSRRVADKTLWETLGDDDG